MSEKFANLANTTVGGTGYTAGSGVLNVASTAPPFPPSATFRVAIADQSSFVVKVLLKVTAINSGTQWAVTAESADVNASVGDLVYAVVTAGALAQFAADIISGGGGGGGGGSQGDPALTTCVPPTTSTFTVTANLGTGTAQSAHPNYGVRFTGGSGQSAVGIFVKTIPNSNFRAVYQFRVTPTDLGTNESGLIFYETSTQKMLFVSLHLQTSMYIDHWNSPTSFSGNPFSGNATITLSNLFILWSLRYDGTKIYVDVSNDGTWRNLYSENANAFFTTAPTHIGVGISNQDTLWLASYQEI